jgi:hypothetical protein
MRSFTRIPNITGFKIELSKFHPILKLFGILLRMSKAELSFILLDKNDRMNDYLTHMRSKLHENRSNPKAFWFYAKLLLARSTSFLVSNIRKSYPTWYKSLTLKFVQDIIKGYQNLNLKNLTIKDLTFQKLMEN